MYNYIIANAKEPVVQPKDIDTSDHFWGAFNNSETEVSARWIVRFCQHRNQGWRPFAVAELEDFYHKGLGRIESFWFNKLHSHWEKSPILIAEDTVILSHEFVAKCYSSSPVRG